MGTKIVKCCDLCEMDGEEEVEAIASYKAGDYKEYQVCKKHLEHVKNAKLKYNLYK